MATATRHRTAERRSPSPEATRARAARSEEARIKRVTLACGNPIFFGEHYMKPYDAVWKRAGSLPRVCGEMLAFAMTSRRGVVITPPEWLKTLTLSQLYPLWLTCTWPYLGRDEHLMGMLTSEEQGLAESNLRVVIQHVEFNQRIAEDFVDADGAPLIAPDPLEAKWTDDEIIVRRQGASKDPTWQAKGRTSQGVQGGRKTHLIADDFVTPRTAGSPAERKRALQLWDDQFTARLLADGQAIVAGNFNDARDLLATLSSRSAYRVFRRPALHIKGRPDVAPEDATDPKAIPSLPEKWPRERLMLERAEKPNRFRRIFLLDSKAETGERLKVGHMSVINAEATPLRQCAFFIALDPAPGSDDPEASGLDFFNVTVGAAHGKHMDIVVSHDVRAETTEQTDLVGTYFDHFSDIGLGVRAIGGAKVSLDRYFRGALGIARPDLVPKIVPVSIPGSKTERLEGLGPYAKSGYLRVWDAVWTQLTSEPEDQPDELSLFEQWRDFPSIPHDDKLDGADVLVRTHATFGYGGKRKIRI